MILGAVPQKQSPGLAERKEKGIVGPRRSGGTGGWVGPGAGLGQGAGWGLVGAGEQGRSRGKIPAHRRAEESGLPPEFTPL